MLRVVLLGVLLILIARVCWRLFDAVVEGVGGSPRRRRAQPPGVRLIRDPVCGTFVAPGSALSLTSRGATYYFCSEKCRGEFGGKP